MVELDYDAIRGTPEQIAAQKAVVERVRLEHGTNSTPFRRENFKLVRLYRRKVRPPESRGGRSKRRRLDVAQALREKTEEAKAALDMACEVSKKKAIQMAQKAAPKLMEALMREAFPVECKVCKHHPRPAVGGTQYRAMVTARKDLQGIVELCLRPDLKDTKAPPKRKLVRVEWPTEGQKS